MKSYREVAENVFRRRDAHEAKREARKKILRRVTTSLSVFAVTVAVLFSVGAGYVFAVGFGIVEDRLGICDRFFSAQVTRQQQSIVENATLELGEEITCNGFSVTAKSAFTDGTTALVLVRITAPESVDLEESGLHFNVDAKGIVRGENPNKILGSTGLRITQIPVEDGDNAKNTQDMLIRIATTNVPGYHYSFADGYLRYIKLEGIYAYEEGYPYTEFQIAEGNWDYKVCFDDTYSHAEREMLSQPVDVELRRALYDVKQMASVHSIKVKGLSVVIRYGYKGNAVQEPGDFEDVQIVLKDGTVIKTKCSTGDLGAYPGEFVTSYLATAPILVNEIDYITIGETIILAEQTTHEGKTMLPFPEE